MASARGFTVITACSLSSYIAMRARYCCTISRDVVRFCSSAVRMSAMLASTTENGLDWAGAGDDSAARITISVFRILAQESGSMACGGSPARRRSQFASN